LPGGQGTASGGQREFVPVLARAAVAVGIAGIFLETHPDPEKALSDGPNSWPLAQMQALLATLKEFDRVAKSAVRREGQASHNPSIHEPKTKNQQEIT
jgi:2-dehydro-3-deoxyphosphooctonate aldolase (KDO 8-P synthase)